MLTRLMRRLRDLFRSTSRLEQDLDAELRSHIDHRVDDLIRDGMSPREARRRARVEFGGPERYAELIREEGRRRWHAIPEGLWHDWRMALRRLAAAPAFAFFAVLSLGLGVGATVAVYAVVHSMAWAPLPIDRPDEVIMVVRPSPGRDGSYAWALMLSRRDFEMVRDTQTTLDHFSAVSFTYLPITGGSATAIVKGEAVSADYFRALGITMAAGRALGAVDQQDGAAPVAVLNAREAEAWFGEAQAAIGEVVRIGGAPHEVVGVVARPFDGIGRNAGSWTTYWVPLAEVATGAGGRSDPAERSLAAFGRLRPGATAPAASAEITALAASLDVSLPDVVPATRQDAGSPWPRGWQGAPASVVMADGHELSTVAAFVVGLTALVLLVACTNLANLVQARGAARARESAVRRALGASRARVVREWLLESTVIATLGLALAWLVARTLLVWFTVDIPTGNGRSVVLTPTLVPAAAVAAVLATLLSLLIFGLLPALRMTRQAEARALAAGTSLGVGRRDGPWRLIRWQVAAAVGFFLIASLTVRVVVDAARHDPGIDLDRLAIASVYFDRDRGQDATAARQTIDRVLELAARQPGITNVAASTGMPFGQTMTPLVAVTTPERPFVAGSRSETSLALVSTPSIFSTLGVSILSGRAFDARDHAGARPVVVISAHEAREVFGTVDVLNRELLVQLWPRENPTLATIIGVASDTDVQSLTRRESGVIYLPLAQAFVPGIAFVARTDSGDPADAATMLSTVLQQVDPDVGLYSAGPANRILAGSYVACVCWPR